MAFQAGQQNQFSRQVNRELVNDQAAAERFNNPVPVGGANPFARTVENPSWLGMNQNGNMVLQPRMVLQPPTTAMVPNQGGTTVVSVPDGRTKRPRFTNHLDELLPAYAPPNIQNEMKALLETDYMLFQQGKRVRMEFVAKHNQAVTHMVENVRAPFLQKLSEKDAQISSMGQLIVQLQEKVSALNNETQYWKHAARVRDVAVRAYGNSLRLLQTQFGRMQGAMPPNGAVAAPPEEQDIESYCGSSISQKNRQAGKADELEEIEKVQTGAPEKGEGSGVKNMCKSCGEMESSFLALPCMHFCFCTVCGTREARLHGPCPVCHSPTTATVPITLI